MYWLEFYYSVKNNKIYAENREFLTISQLKIK